MNHLEQLVSEWLQYRGYFVRTSVPVGPRPAGGFEGELDVVALHPTTKHLLHIECSLDALSEAKRQEHYATKFQRGETYARAVFDGIEGVGQPEKIVVLMAASGSVRRYGGARLVTVRELVAEIQDGLAGTSPMSGAVSANLPLLRTLQLAFYARNTNHTEHGILGHKEADEGGRSAASCRRAI